MRHIVFLLMWIRLSTAIREHPFKSESIQNQRQNDAVEFINNQFIIFFDNDCLSDKRQDGYDDVSRFLGSFPCYTRSTRYEDSHPETCCDQFVVVNHEATCTDDDDKTIRISDFCISEVIQDFIVSSPDQQSESATCGPRDTDFDFDNNGFDDSLWHLESLNPARENSLDYVELGTEIDPEFDIYVVDSGIDAAHPEFDNINIDHLFQPSGITELASTHGTSVASMIVGNNVGVFKPNTKVTVYDVQVFERRIDDDGNIIKPVIASQTDVMNAYKAIIVKMKQEEEEHPVPRKGIINLSFGGERELDTIENSCFPDMVRNGGIIFAAAGNDAKLAANHAPARHPLVISVGAIQEPSNDESDPYELGFFGLRAANTQDPPNCFVIPNDMYFCGSNYGDDVDIWAPGTLQVVAIWNLTKDDNGQPTTEYVYEKQSGTSFASPLAAGVAANIWAADPELLSVRELNDTVINNAVVDFACLAVNCMDHVDDRQPRLQGTCDIYTSTIDKSTTTNTPCTTKKKKKKTKGNKKPNKGRWSAKASDIQNSNIDIGADHEIVNSHQIIIQIDPYTMMNLWGILGMLLFGSAFWCVLRYSSTCVWRNVNKSHEQFT